MAHALRMLELIGCADVPVLVGATYPLLNSAEATKRWEARYGRLFYKGAWMEEWPPEVQVRRLVPHGPEVVPAVLEGEPTNLPATESAAAFLVRQVRAWPGEVSIVALGPLTNLALAIRLDDGFAAAVWLDPSLVTQAATLAVDVDTDHGAGYGNTLSWAAGAGPRLGERDVRVVFEVDGPQLNNLVVRRLQ